MLKFLADMGIAQHSVAFLRQKGHDATHLREEGLQRLGDDEIIEKALREQRVILTHDLDFSRLVAVGGSQLPSVVTFRLRDMRPSQVEHALAQILQHHAEALDTGALVSVSERAIRVRPLPIEK